MSIKFTKPSNLITFLDMVQVFGDSQVGKHPGWLNLCFHAQGRDLAIHPDSEKTVGDSIINPDLDLRHSRWYN